MLSVTVLISRTLPFGLSVTLTSVFNFIILLSYRAIRVFLVRKFSCSIAIYGHEPSHRLMLMDVVAPWCRQTKGMLVDYVFH